jgi:hypothetical protein
MEGGLMAGRVGMRRATSIQDPTPMRSKPLISLPHKAFVEAVESGRAVGIFVWVPGQHVLSPFSVLIAGRPQHGDVIAVQVDKD